MEINLLFPNILMKNGVFFYKKFFFKIMHFWLRPREAKIMVNKLNDSKDSYSCQNIESLSQLYKIPQFFKNFVLSWKKLPAQKLLQKIQDHLPHPKNFNAYFCF